MPAQPDDACGGTPVWSAELDAVELARAFRAAGFRGERLSDLRILSRDASGRVAKLRLDGMTPDEISGQGFCEPSRAARWGGSTSRARRSNSNAAAADSGSTATATATA